MPVLTTGDLCRRLGVLPWQVLAAIRRGYVPEPPRAGVYRLWRDEDVPRVREALVKAGYLPDAEVAHA